MTCFEGPECHRKDGKCLCDRFITSIYGVEATPKPEPNTYQLIPELLDVVDFKQPWEE